VTPGVEGAKNDNSIMGVMQRRLKMQITQQNEEKE